MPGHLQIAVAFDFKKEDADGSECLHCHEIAWLTHWRLLMGLGNQPTEPTKQVLCDACYQAWKGDQ